MITFTARGLGFEDFIARLQAFGVRITDLRFMWPALAAKFYDIEREQFKTEGGRAHKWARNRAGYARWKQAKYPGSPILQLSGRLTRSMTQRSAPDAIYEEGPMFLRLGSSGVGVLHQLGTDNMVARPVIDLIPADIEAFMSIARAELEAHVQSLGFKPGSLGV